ncbi:ferritin-like domain-containing protein [Gillisia sp. JM1]|uniref:ferritin-like domain-containing protein n=1 Tax=Gillisia sp. JM1 TaxID=1283286 RepID=UPI0004060B0C|nr:ferritin-like domain-containing protein [Gillisia sp. JM1]
MKKPMINVESFHDGREGKMNSRRKFLKIGGLAVVGSSLFLYSCEEDGITDEEINALDAKGVNNKKVFNLGKGDLAILNYAYILEQLEAAFYTEVVNGSYYEGISDAKEKQIITDLWYHEVIHRDFFKIVLNSIAAPGRVAPDLNFDFSGVDFGSRENVLTVSRILEDTGVSAYNGAGKLLESTEYLLIAGKIVSVEARHASAIRDLLEPGTTNFASDEILVDLGGTGEAYDEATSPQDVLAAVAATGFLETKIIANNIPTA